MDAPAALATRQGRLSRAVLRASALPASVDCVPSPCSSSVTPAPAATSTPIATVATGTASAPSGVPSPAATATSPSSGVSGSTPYQQINSLDTSDALPHIRLGNDLSCQVERTGDSSYAFFPRSGLLGNCGAFVVVTSTNALYAPNFFSSNGGVAFTPVSQSGVSGAGTDADPYRVTTVVDAGATGLRLTQTDSYVAGNPYYRTDVSIANTGAAAQGLILYRGADCYLAGSDSGYGAVDAGARAVSCAQNPNNTPPGRVETFQDISGGSHYDESYFSNVWSRIRTHADLPNACDCTTFQDNGMALSYPITIPAGGQAATAQYTILGIGVGTVLTATSIPTPAGTSPTPAGTSPTPPVVTAQPSMTPPVTPAPTDTQAPLNVPAPTATSVPALSDTPTLAPPPAPAPIYAPTDTPTPTNTVVPPAPVAPTSPLLAPVGVSTTPTATPAGAPPTGAALAPAETSTRSGLSAAATPTAVSVGGRAPASVLSTTPTRTPAGTISTTSRRVTAPATRSAAGQPQPTVVVPRGGNVQAGGAVTVTLRTRPRAAVSIDYQLVQDATPTPAARVLAATRHSAKDVGVTRHGAKGRQGYANRREDTGMSARYSDVVVRSVALAKGASGAAAPASKGNPTPRSSRGAAHPTTIINKGKGYNTSRGSQGARRGGSASSSSKDGSASRKGQTRAIVLYHATVRTHADSKGRVTQQLRLNYFPAKAVRVTLVVTVRTPFGASTRRTRITITPVHHRFR